MANTNITRTRTGRRRSSYSPASNVNYASGGLANPHNYWIPFIQGHVENNNAHENAFSGDLKYDFVQGQAGSTTEGGSALCRPQPDRPLFDVQLDADRGELELQRRRVQCRQYTQPNPTAACDLNFKGYGANIFGPYSFGNLYDGNVYNNGSLVFVNNSALTNYNRLMAGLSGAATNSPILPGYVPICDRAGTTTTAFYPQR